jgi:hypothetical protein
MASMPAEAMARRGPSGLSGDGPAGQRLGQRRPRGIADPVPECQERAQISRTAAGEEGGSYRGVAVEVTVALEQAECDHRVGADPGRAVRQSSSRGQRGQGRRRVGEGLEQAEFVRREQMPGCHEP